jgi:hypothetical protein
MNGLQDEAHTLSLLECVGASSSEAINCSEALCTGLRQELYVFANESVPVVAFKQIRRVSGLIVECATP